MDPAAGNPVAGAAPDNQEQIGGIFENARDLFSKGNYSGALEEIDKAGALAPKDPDIHQFRALCLFALKDYRSAAAALYAVLAAGPGWDWTTVSNMYPSTSAYTAQLRALEAYSEKNPNATDARFVLAYQYLVTGHNEQAIEELKIITKLQPNDQLAAQLLQNIGAASRSATRYGACWYGACRSARHADRRRRFGRRLEGQPAQRLDVRHEPLGR